MQNRKKVIVTGGAGYIGSHTVVELQAAGYESIIIDNFSNSEASVPGQIAEICGSRPTVYEADCTDAAAMRDIFRKEGEV